MNKIIQLGEVSSTNVYAAENFDSLADGTLILAEVQTAGRGRLGRPWMSPKGNLYASFVMKDLFGEPFHATMVSSLAVIAVLKDLLPASGAFIKWPNDVYVGYRKLSGILCEGVIRKGSLAGIICGIGVNIALSEKELEKIDQPAISLNLLADHEISLKIFAEKLAVYLNWYYIIGIDSRDRLFSLWKEENRLIGRQVMLCPPNRMPFQAAITDISEDGRLQVTPESGDPETFACGDVKILLE